MRLILRVLINAFAIWLTTLIVSGVKVIPFAEGTLPTVLTYLLLGVIFGVVNGIIGGAIRVIAFPLYILTLGLLGLIVNGLLLLLTAWISGLFGFGLTVAGFWWGVLGALILAIISGLLGLIFRPAGRRG